jgi:hypothetical protein
VAVAPFERGDQRGSDSAKNIAWMSVLTVWQSIKVQIIYKNYNLHIKKIKKIKKGKNNQ